jgi:hypothetical protein
MCTTGVSVAGNPVVPTTTLANQKANNTSAANSFAAQSNGNAGAGNISKADIHSLLYPGSTTKIYAHLMLWFGGSNHMNVGYSSADAQQVHRQILDMISRGIDGVIVDWYGPNNTIDQATKLVMTEAEAHPGFTFAIMVDQGAIKWNSCSGCTPQQALISQMQYVEQTYFPSKAYLRIDGNPVVTNFDIDLAYSIDWNAVSAALSAKPAFLFQNNSGFSHVLSNGSYSWVMPTTTDYGMSYLKSFYGAGISAGAEKTVGATYKGFNDTLAGWGSNRVMGQQCGQTWLKTFSQINSLYHSGKQLPILQLVTWNDYEEGTEIESGINNCLSISASATGNSLQWSIKGNENTVDHYAAFISTDGTNLKSLAHPAVGIRSLNLCSYAIPNGNYTFYVQAVGKPSITNQMSAPVKASLKCTTASSSDSGLTLEAAPSAMTVSSASPGSLSVSITPVSGTYSNAIALTCAGLPSNLKCAFAPSSVVPGSNTASSILTVTANSTLAATNSHDGSSFALVSGLFGLGPFGFVLAGRIRRRVWHVVAACLLAIMSIAIASCGGQSARTIAAAGAPNSHVVTINGDAASTHISTIVSITVN